MEKIEFIKRLESILQKQEDNTFVFDEGTTLDLVLWGQCTTTKLFRLYLTNVHNRAGNNIILISRPLSEIENVNGVDDMDYVLHFSLTECKQILDKVVEQISKREYEKIYKMLRVTDADFDEICQLEEQVEISVTWGDWKHSHIFLDNIMRNLGYRLIDEQITETDNSDCYSSVHIYKKN